MLNARIRTRRGAKNLSQVEQDVYNLVKDGKVTYANIDDKIRQIGGAIGKDTDMYSTVDSATLRDMYGKLSTLRDGVLGTYGQSGNASRARKLGSTRFGLQEATGNLFGKKHNQSIFPKIDGKLSRISTGQVREFESLMNTIPEKYRGTVIATSINRALTGGTNGAQRINATQFSKWFDNIKRNDTAYSSFKKYAPEGSIDRLEALATLSKGVSGVTSKRIRTGIVPETLKRLDDTVGIVGKLYGRATGGQGAISDVARMIEPKKTPASEAADKLMTSPEFRRAFISAAEGGTNTAKYRAQSAILKKSKFYKDYINKLDGGTKASIISTGLIPWLATEEDSE